MIKSVSIRWSPSAIVQDKDGNVYHVHRDWLMGMGLNSTIALDKDFPSNALEFLAAQKALEFSRLGLDRPLLSLLEQVVKAKDLEHLTDSPFEL